MLTTILLSTGAGCGSDPLSEQELIAQGDELCRKGQERFAEIQAEPPADADAAVDQTGELIDASKDEVDGLRDLEPPSELEDPYDSYIDAREEAIGLLEDGRGAAEDQDASAYGKAQAEVAGKAGERLKLARAVGFKDCSRPQRAPARSPSASGN